MSKGKMVSIPEKRYKELLEAEGKLSCLEAYGVDNWCGYGDAMSEYYNEEEEE